MPKAFISFTPHRKKVAEWLAEILKAFGFEESILASGSGAGQKASRKKSKEELDHADCFVALVSPERGSDGQSTDPNQPAPWIEHDAVGAFDRDLPIALIWEKNLVRRPALDDMAFAREEVNFDDPAELLALIPRIVEIGMRLRSSDKTEEDFPYTLEKIHFVDRLSESEWCHLRMISLVCRKHKEAKEIDHSVDVGMDKAAGISVKLTKPLSVTCEADRTRIRVKMENEDDKEVWYKVQFTPALKVLERIQYRHESHHMNIFPMTRQAVEERSLLKGSPPFMQDGFVGNWFDINKPTGMLEMEIEAPLSLGLASPQVKAYALNSTYEIESESDRIGTPSSKPSFWKVTDESEAQLRGIWNCRVKIKDPKGYCYCLVVKPTR